MTTVLMNKKCQPCENGTGKLTPTAVVELLPQVPGWTHDVTNVGEALMVSLIWANEIFDRERPDTVAMKV